MIAQWMLYCSLCALGLSVAAVIAERALLAGRAPVRLVWIGAVTLSLLLPAAAYRFAPRRGAQDAAATVHHDATTNPVPDSALSASLPVVGLTLSASRRWDWPATLARLDEPMAVAWATLSLALAVNFLGGMVTLAWMRRRWQRRIVLDVPVFVSERTGPAVVGAVSPSIVLPEWVLALEPHQLALMLRHEQEHRRAGDAQLLTIAQLALIAMPWNVALWWQILRLRVAVELDCDARVLQEADARSYGDLLLEVARPRRRPSLMGATAFAERATQLERRIRVLARHRVHTSRAARAIAAGIGLTAVTVAWVAPRPPAPAREPAPVDAPPSPHAVSSPAAPSLPNAPAPSMDRMALAPSDARTASRGSIPREQGNAARADRPVETGATSPTDRDRPRDISALPLIDSVPFQAGRGGTPAAAQSVDSIFKRLFDGITLTPDQAAKVRETLSRLQQAQQAQDQATLVTQLQNRARNLSLQLQRDSALRSLLTNDADRATFDTRVAQGAGGGRGRGGGPGPDSLAGGRRGGRGDTLLIRRFDSTIRFYNLRYDSAGGRSGGRGGREPVAADVAILFTSLDKALGQRMTETTFHRLFDGIALTAQQEASARALLTKAQDDMGTPVQRRPPVVLRMNWQSGLIAIRAPGDSALLAILSDDADRAKLRARIVSIPR